MAFQSLLPKFYRGSLRKRPNTCHCAVKITPAVPRFRTFQSLNLEIRIFRPGKNINVKTSKTKCKKWLTLSVYIIARTLQSKNKRYVFDILGNTQAFLCLFGWHTCISLPPLIYLYFCHTQTQLCSCTHIRALQSNFNHLRGEGWEMRRRRECSSPWGGGDSSAF